MKTHPTLSSAFADNPNHHLWNNNGTWFIHYTCYPTAFTKERVRRTLGTHHLPVARARRDAVLRACGNLALSA